MSFEAGSGASFLDGLSALLALEMAERPKFRCLRGDLMRGDGLLGVGAVWFAEALFFVGAV